MEHEVFNERIWHGAASLLDSYAKVRRDDVAIVIYTVDSYEPAAWVSAALEVRNIEVRRLPMKPLVDATFGTRLKRVLSASPIPGRVVIFTFERDTMSHTQQLNDVLSSFAPERRAVLRMISATAELFEDALDATPEQLSAANCWLLQTLMPARKLRIRTDGGTDITLTLDSSRRWISNRGYAGSGGTIVLPAGEVATCPTNVDGVFIADFAFNVNTVTERDARLNRSPVTIRLKSGRAVEASCNDQEIQKFVNECFSMEYGTRVGELGFGTNPAVVAPIAFNSHRNERCPGVHLGFGQHNQERSLMGYQALIHLDLIAKGGKVWVDQDENAIELAVPHKSSAQHPRNVLDEDVFSPDASNPHTALDLTDQDCCGILGQDAPSPADCERPHNYWSDHAEALAEAYLSSDGSLSHALITRAIQRHLGADRITAGDRLRVLDVGCGQGVQARTLARMGHAVTALESDRKMLDAAERALRAEDAGVRARVNLMYGRGEDALTLVGSGFDLVCCHSVLMYLEHPQSLIDSLVSCANPNGGVLSIVSVNPDALAMRPGLQGSWPEAVETLRSGHQSASQYVRTAPPSLETLREWFERRGASMIQWYGVGIFTDHRDAPVASDDPSALVEAEWLAGERDPYRRVARCFHLLIQRDSRAGAGHENPRRLGS